MSAKASLPLGVVVNPHSALGRGRRAGRRVAEHLARHGVPVTVLSGSDAAECAEAIRLAAPNVRGFLLVGGDGLLSMFLQIPEARVMPFAIVPAGSGNDFAREFGVPRHQPVKALRRALRGEAHPRKVDALLVSGADGVERWVGCGFSLGFDAHINRRANSIRLQLGPLRYQLALIAEVIAGQSSTFDLTIDGVRRSYPGLLTTVMNTRTLGGGIPITPGADPMDGKLDVISVDQVTRKRLFSVLGMLARGTHPRLPEVHIVRGRSITLAADGEQGYADGELVGQGPFTIRVAPGALTVWA